ncbi:MAG: protein-L-isoaspartate(D-aspartate) O-methyltransferase [Bacteroidales bacterium]|nr:protein-L-isoaspartate(D-aspartate) O-methyltransferase [Bacteroidales bacterium]
MQGRRARLVETIKGKGIKDERVLNAIGNIKRHLFVLKGLEYSAYEDRALSISASQTISQPYTVAFQTELLELKSTDKVLEIGTGSGYQAAVLAEIGVDVYTVERIEELHISATELLKELGYKVNTFYSDGFIGLDNYAPFDKIIITAAIPEIPDSLLSQLKIGGIMVAPEGIAGQGQVMRRIIRVSETDFERQNHGLFTFVPMLKGKN